MAYNQFDVSYEQISITGGTPLYTIGLIASTNVVVKVLEFSISFDGSTSSNTPAQIQFSQCTFTTLAPGTASTSTTPAKKDTGRAETFLLTAATTWTSTPTTTTRQWGINVGVFNGLYHYIHPFSSPWIAIGGKGCVVKISAANTVNANGKMSGEE